MCSWKKKNPTATDGIWARLLMRDTSGPQSLVLDQISVFCLSVAANETRE